MIDKPEISVNLLRLADGTLIDPLTRVPVTGSQSLGVDEEPSSLSSTPVSITPDVRRSLLDLTLSHQQMAFVNNVLVYTLWGLPDDEIATVCGCSAVDVQIVRDLKEYGEMHDGLMDGIRRAYIATAHGIIASAADTAAGIVVNALRSKSPRMQMEAAKDVLDRSGHRPADHQSLNLKIGDEDSLVIRVVRESEKPRIPTIDLSVGN